MPGSAAENAAVRVITTRGNSPVEEIAPNAEAVSGCPDFLCQRSGDFRHIPGDGLDGGPEKQEDRHGGSPEAGTLEYL